MYIAQTLKDRIKNQCKVKGITIKTMLMECGLSINAISQINDTAGMYSFNLARIADYLDCSVDYLLGRTTDPSSHKQTIIIGGKTMSFAERLREAMRVRGVTAAELTNRIYGKDDAESEERSQHISRIISLVNGREPNDDDKQELPKALNVAVSQLTGKEEITAENIRPYLSDTDDLRDIGFAAFNGVDGTKDDEVEQYLRTLKNHKENQ